MAERDNDVFFNDNASFSSVLCQHMLPPTPKPTSPFSTPKVYQGAWGTIPALQCLVEQVRKQKIANVQSANPVSVQDAEQTIAVIKAALPAVPAALAAQIAMDTATIAGIGEKTSIFAIAQDFCGKATFDQADVHGALVSACEKDDGFFLRWVGPWRRVWAGRDARSIRAIRSHLCSVPQCSMGLPEHTLAVPKLCILLAVMQHLQLQR